MVMTVPELSRDALESLVEPDVLMEDDGCTETFAKAFIYDDMPVVEVDDDLGSVMRLTDPTLCAVMDLHLWDAASDQSEDGLEQAWFDAMRYVVPEFPAAIAAPEAPVLIAAPAALPSLGSPFGCVRIGAPEEIRAIAAPAAEAVEDIVAGTPVEPFSSPMVSFSFGPASADTGGWRVVFSF